LFSRRSGVELTPNAYSEAVARARARGGALLDLTVSNPTSAGIPYAPDVATALAAGASTYEPEPLGLPVARDAVAALWRSRGVVAEPERILLTASTSEAYAFTLKLLCDPGDELLVPAPSYPLFEHLARVESVSRASYRLGFDGAWFIDADSVRAAITPRTRAIVVVSPNNPTGSFLKRDELAKLSALGLPLISDEVFGEYGFEPDPRRAASALEGTAPLVVALDGLSKAAALPQLKLAWMTLGGEPVKVREAMARLELVADTFLSASTPVQRALPKLLETRRTAADAVRTRTRQNLSLIRSELRGSAATLLPVEGGWYAVLRLPATQSDEGWALALVEHGVLVQPGYFFDLEDGAYVVLSLLTPEATLAEGVGALVSVVDR
jgi:aspartate/methionine/tyrosine aminotransferase